MKYDCCFIDELDTLKRLNFFNSVLYKKKVTNPIYTLLSQKYYNEYYQNVWQDFSICLYCDESVKAFAFLFVYDYEASFFKFPGLLVVDDEVPPEGSDWIDVGASRCRM